MARLGEMVALGKTLIKRGDWSEGSRVEITYTMEESVRKYSPIVKLYAPDDSFVLVDWFHLPKDSGWSEYVAPPPAPAPPAPAPQKARRPGVRR